MNLLDLVAKLSFDDSDFQKGVSNAESTIQKMGKVIGGVASAGAVLKIGKDALTVGMDFDSAMSQVAATMGLSQEEIEATGGSFEQLRNKALEMGSATKFTSTESANALNFLAMAGLSTEQSLILLPKVLTAAGASGMDLATTSDKLTNIMSAMGLTSKDTATLMSNADYVIDTLAMTSTKANTDVSGLFESLSTVGSTAKMMVNPVGELSIATGILADNDIQASEAGTHLRNIIMSLGTPTDKGALALEKLGVSAWDSDGNFKPLGQTLQELNSSLDGMSQEERMNMINKIFNTTDISAVNALLDNCGDRWTELGANISGAEGSAQKMYDTQQNNLKGSLTEMSSAVEGLGIALSDKLSPILEPIVEKITEFAQELTKVINGTKEANPWLQAFAGVLIGVGVALAFIKGVGIVSSILGFIKVLFNAMKMVQSFKGAWAILAFALGTNPIVLLVAAIVGLVAGFIYLWNTSEGFRNFWIWAWENIKTFFVNAWNKIVEFVTVTIPQMIQNIITWFSELPGKIYTWLLETLAKVGQWASEMWNKFLEMCSNILNSIIEWFTQLPTRIWEFLTQTYQNVVQWAGDMWNKFIEMCGNILNSVVEWFAQLPYQIGYYLGYGIGTVVQWGIDIWNKFIEICGKVIEIVVEFFKELPGKIRNFLTGVVHKVIEWRTQMVEKAKEIGKAFIENVVNFFKELPGKIRNFLTGVVHKVIEWRNELVQKAKEIGEAFVDKIVTFFKELPGKIWSVLTAIIHKIIQWKNDLVEKAKDIAKWFKDTLIENLKNLPSKMLQIGKDIVNGVWHGIKSMASNFANDVKNFFKGIVDGAKDALGIHSPSREMRDEVGKWIPLGVGEGIEKEMPRLKNQLEEEMNELSNVRLTPKVDTIAQLSNSINGMVQRNIEVVFNVDGREFNRQVVAPYQNEVQRYNQVRRTK